MRVILHYRAEGRQQQPKDKTEPGQPTVDVATVEVADKHIEIDPFPLLGNDSQNYENCKTVG